MSDRRTKESYYFITPQPWTPERDQILIDRYEKEGATQIAKDMGRTPEAIKSRAYVLGLKVRSPRRGNPPKPQAINQLALGVRSTKKLEPVPPEVERAAIATFLATREVTKCPPMYAHGGEGIQHIGYKQGTNRGARKL